MPSTAATENQGGTAQEGAEGEGTTPAANPGTGTGIDVATLASRVAGLEARLTETGRTKAQIERERDEARQKLADYEAGKLGENEAFKAELQREREARAQAERTASLARIEARYPETFGVLGEAAANLTDEQLAAAEARFKGVTVESEPPTPRNPSAQRPSAAQAAPGEARDGDRPTYAQLRAQFKKVRAPW